MPDRFFVRLKITEPWVHVESSLGALSDALLALDPVVVVEDGQKLMTLTVEAETALKGEWYVQGQLEHRELTSAARIVASGPI